MKKISFVLLLFIFGSLSNELQAQSVISYKTKTAANESERTKILDIVRASLYQGYRQEFIFVVNRLNLSGGYAWFEGEAQRKDGRPVRLEDYEDCCHVEALLKKSNGKWYLVEIGAFSTDVWYEDLMRNSGAPKAIFFK